MENFIRHRTRMREAARAKAKAYLQSVTDDYDLVIDAVAEMLWEDFGIKNEACKNMAKSLIGPIWDDVVAEVNTEAEEAEGFRHDREAALIDAREGGW